MPQRSEFTLLVIEIIRSIPEGKVASYGQIAREAGFPRMSRQVSWVLNRDSRREGLPWHRVINSSGGISLKGEAANLQKALLESEGIVFSPAGKVSLKRYGCFG